jgi:hypothetical protein
MDLAAGRGGGWVGWYGAWRRVTRSGGGGRLGAVGTGGQRLDLANGAGAFMRNEEKLPLNDSMTSFDEAISRIISGRVRY